MKIRFSLNYLLSNLFQFASHRYVVYAGERYSTLGDYGESLVSLKFHCCLERRSFCGFVWGFEYHDKRPASKVILKMTCQKYIKNLSRMI